MQIKKLYEDAILPEKAHLNDAGFDIFSYDFGIIHPGQRQLFKTGFAVYIPEGYVGLICPRSGLAAKHGITVLNSPGVIDSGYTGEVLIILHNSSDVPFGVSKGNRIAQLVVTPIYQQYLTEVNEFSNASDRGANGFGSTGLD